MGTKPQSPNPQSVLSKESFSNFINFFQNLKPGASKSEAAINAARLRLNNCFELVLSNRLFPYFRRRGEVVSTEQKFGAATNKHGTTSLNTAKLDQETEELKHDRVSLDVGKLIQKGRNAKVFYFQVQADIYLQLLQCQIPTLTTFENRD